MRKLLLASVATLGFAGSAYAASLVEVNPDASPPAMGTTGGVLATNPLTAWNAPKTNPDPGKVIVHISGIVDIDAGGGIGNTYNGQAGTPNAAAKSDHYGMGGFYRLYIGFDGKLANGMIYGSNSEMRTTFAGQNGVAGGYAGVTGTQQNGSANSTAELWYVRRAYVYMGAPNVGLFRIGQGDGVTSLFNQPSITTGEQYDTGQWDGNFPDVAAPGNASLAWAFNDTGNEYDPLKIVYMTPSFAGFVFAVDFAPNSNALQSGDESNNAASGGLANQSSSTLSSDWARPRNTFEVGGRYTGTLGPVSIEASLALQKSGVVGNASLPPSPNAGVTKFKGVSAIDTGVGLTMFGASIFGHYYGGTMNGVVTPQAEIPGRSKDGQSFVYGAMWTGGPWTVGASMYQFESEGSAATVSGPIPAGFPGAGTTVTLGNRVERGFDTGFTYNLAPGCNILADYIIGWRHQVGVNFVDPAGSPRNGNQTYIAGVVVSTAFLW